MIQKTVKKHDSDSYIKHFKCQAHLSSMVFCCLEKCNSLREFAQQWWVYRAKNQSSESTIFTKISTLADANKVRKMEFFEEVYNSLLKEYSFFVSDNRIEIALGKKIKIVDSTTISPFKDISACVGRKPAEGKVRVGARKTNVPLFFSGNHEL